MTSQSLARLKGRIKYGLLTQEILDRLGKLGVRVTPYLLVDESPGALLDFEVKATACTMRPLLPDDMPLIVNMPGRKRKPDQISTRLNEADCLGVFVGDALAGYTWSRYDRIASSSGRIELYRLGPNEAYLFDMFIDKSFRGMALAPLLRHCLYQRLLAKGIRIFYSITSYFNRSSRRFKAKLGAQELELRVGLSSWSLWDADFLLKRYVADHPLRTRRAYFAHGQQSD